MRAGIGFLLLLLASFSGRAVNVFVTHTLFYAPEGKVLAPYVEMFWEIDAASLHYTQEDGGWVSKMDVQLAVTTDTGKLVEERFVLRTPPAATREEAQNQLLIDIKRFHVPPGVVRIEMTFKEAVGKPFVFSDSLTVADAQVSFASGVQLIDTAYRSEEKNMFQRNAMMHIPLSVPFYDQGRSMLHYYFELYGTDSFRAEAPLVLKTFLSRKKNENVMPQYISSDTIVPGRVVPHYGSFPIAELPSGNYYINASLFSSSGKRLAQTNLFFQRLNKMPPKKETPVIDSTEKPDLLDTSNNIVVFNINKTFVAKYTHAQIKAIMKMLLPIASVPEQQNIQAFLKNPDELYSRYLVYNFWLNRNADKPEKEWDAYADRVREVNKLFGGTQVPGYETDRGFTYLKFGKPNERIVMTNEEGALPYEIWQYFQVANQGKDGVFLFYQPANTGNDYRLLHSTVTGEVKDFNWRTSLYPGRRGGVMDSKAEQYLRNR